MAIQSFRQTDGSHKSGLTFVPSTFALLDQADGDVHRRISLETSDLLLEEIEQLRLIDQMNIPPSLRERIRALHAAVTGVATPAKLKTCRAAHDLVLALQDLLLAANPHNGADRRRSTHRAPGQPIIVSTSFRGTWKLLSLPPEPASGLSEEWFAAAAATIERAWDRWSYAQHHAIAASRRRSRQSRTAVVRAMVAWSNYWQLLDEVDRIRDAAALGRQ
jgi:hypothetical protein